jgi:putative transposase
VVKPAVRRDVVRLLQGAYGVGERRAVRATGFHRSSQRYRFRRDPQTELRVRLRDLAASRVRYGYPRLHVLLRREGWPVNAKRVWRLYAEEGLTIRAMVPRRKRAWRYRVGRPRATAPNEVWSMDFVSDQLFGGRPIRILAVLDAHTREALSIVPRASFRTFDMVVELTRLARERDRPKTLKVDNGPEFAGRLLDQWAHLNGVEIDFSRPGKPTDNAHIEAFNSRLRAECLNASWFLSLADARDRLEVWRREYNDERPHGSLRNLTPRAFAEQAQQARRVA